LGLSMCVCVNVVIEIKRNIKLTLFFAI
jgi:hypothetical protein